MVLSGRVVGQSSVSCGCPTMSRASVGRGGLYEAHIPTEHPSTLTQARVPSSDEHQGGSCDSQIASPQRSPPPVSVIGRLHGRSVFTTLRQRGVRVRSGWLWCSMVVDPAETVPRVGYAIGRAYGNAVQRNLLRRRLRAAFSVHDASLPAGSYLVGAASRDAQPTWPEVLRAVDRLVALVQTKAVAR